MLFSVCLFQLFYVVFSMLDFLLLRGLEYKLQQKQPPFSTQV
ncbi:hypothetical protein HanRHA438_Chr14g0651481 [Helianthus annuus]|nr:hypothetical protein HanRHA438_Chr14g0651481 [Helianthus annuus]